MIKIQQATSLIRNEFPPRPLSFTRYPQSTPPVSKFVVYKIPVQGPPPPQTLLYSGSLIVHVAIQPSLTYLPSQRSTWPSMKTW